MTAPAALLTVLLPVVAALLGLPTGRRSRPWAREWAVLGSGGALAAALIELLAVAAGDGSGRIGLLGRVDTGATMVGLDLRADSLSAVVAVAVGLVATCVQVYSAGYLPTAGAPGAPSRYAPYAATVSLFTAAMMLVVHADDLILLLIGWEVMGLCSYLLVGHHSERPAARAAALKAFLVTRVGDVGVLLAVVVLLAAAGTTSIPAVLQQARDGELSTGTLTLAALLLLAGAAGKSAQFPLHTWLPDAMEGPTPVSALIHAATMVAAGVFLLARLLPLYLAAPGALQVAAVIAAITMLGAALAALAQEDLKRLLAWSTISQVAYMLGGVAVAQDERGAGPGVLHLISHAAFKALLFLVAGCVIRVAGSGLMAEQGGLLRRDRRLAVLLGLGLAGLAGIPPLGGFWSKEAVLAAAEESVRSGNWTGWLVLCSGLLTTLVTGLYAGRAWSLVALGDPPRQEAEPASLPATMTGPMLALAVPTVLLGLLLLAPPAALAGVRLDAGTAFIGTVLTLAGVGWALSGQRFGAPDVALALPGPVRAFLLAGYRLDDAQDRLVVRPILALARLVGAGDRDVVDAYVRGSARLAGWSGVALRSAQRGLVTGYLTWVVAGAVLVGLGMVLV